MGLSGRVLIYKGACSGAENGVGRGNDQNAKYKVGSEKQKLRGQKLGSLVAFLRVLGRWERSGWTSSLATLQLCL